MGLLRKNYNKYQTGGLQHLLASQIRQEVGDQIFNSYFKFTIVRNPWDRIVSQYVYMSARDDLRAFIGMSQGDSLKRYLELIGRTKHVQWEKQVAFVQDPNGSLLVDYVGRFEQFSDSVAHILRTLGIPSCSLPHKRRGDRGPYHEYYDDESREMVASMFSEDIASFGYSFEVAQRPVDATNKSDEGIVK